MLLGIPATLVHAQDSELYPNALAASSTLYEEGYDHNPGNLTDWNYSSAWVEGSEGDGIGEFVDYFFPQGTVITGVSILPGYCKSDYVFFANNAVSEIRVQSGYSFSDIYLWDVVNTFTPSRQPVRFDFYTPIICDGTLRFSINAVRAGSKYSDSCISEIHVYGKRADGKAAGVYPSETIDAEKVSKYAFYVFEKYIGDTPITASVSLDMLSDRGKAFLLYWYQYFSQNDDRVVKEGDSNRAQSSDLKEMLSALTGTFSEGAWNRFIELYVQHAYGETYYMNATGDFGNARPYLFRDAVDQGINDGLRCITGRVWVLHGQDKTFCAYFRQTDSPTLDGWQLVEVSVQ